MQERLFWARQPPSGGTTEQRAFGLPVSGTQSASAAHANHLTAVPHSGAPAMPTQQ